ncbi:MAG: hypothetical protein BA872_06450 [Desulfobacterales bacterium C00003060]|nr:MAG: hypothetical protein BA861_06665 [Desulfobacterales bacterium S3730MH5]OEU79330.1 MAG: hypothetical protein BA872_06450 [Desulfobacterales bacterium C00003060]
MIASHFRNARNLVLFLGGKLLLLVSLWMKPFNTKHSVNPFAASPAKKVKSFRGREAESSRQKQGNPCFKS